MLTILYLFVNTLTLVMVMDRTYKFINGITILYLMYWDYYQMDAAFSDTMQSFKVI